MDRSCARCGGSFSSDRRSARFCSDRCRSAAKRARQAGQSEGGTVSSLPVNPAGGSDVSASLTAVTRAELLELGQSGTTEGMSAIKLAEMIDNAKAVMGYAALVKQHHEMMAEARKVADAGQSSGDVLDVIEQAALRVLEGA